MSPIPPPDPLGVAALSAQQLRAFRNRNEVKNLLRLVAKEVGQAVGLPPGTESVVRRKVMGLGTDPWLMGALKRLLEEGDLSAKTAIGDRLSQILTFGNPDLDRLELPALAARSFERNAPAAKRDPRRAAHLDELMTRNLVESKIEQLQSEMRAGFDEIQSLPVGAGLGGGGALLSDHELPTRSQAALAALDRSDAGAGAQLRAALAAGGAERVVELIEDPQPWVRDGGSALWSALGRLALQSGAFAADEKAHLASVERPDVDDRAREIIRASRAAALAGNGERAEELLAEAETIDPRNPAVAIARARQEEDPERLLELLEDVRPVDEEQTVVIELTRAGAELGRGEFELGSELIERARAIEPDSGAADELEAMSTLLKAQEAGDKEHGPARSELLGAGRTLGRLGREVAEEKRAGAAATVLGRAAIAFGLAGEETAGRAELEEALRLVAGDEEAGEVIAEAALLLDRADVIPTLRLKDGERADLLRASAVVHGDDQEGLAAAVDVLDALLGSEREEIRQRAAVMRLGAASSRSGIPWSERAGALVASERPEVAAILRAEMLAGEGRIAEARATVGPHSGVDQALRLQVKLAVEEESWEESLRLCDELISRRADPLDELNRVSLLLRTGDREGALQQLRGLARDQRAPTDLRTSAYGRLSNLQMEAGELVELARTSAEWAEFAPDQDDPIWLHLFARCRRSEHREALSYWREHPVEVESEDQALLLSEAFSFGAPRGEALEKLAELSDRFERPEALELNLMMTTLRREGEESEAEISEELGERIRETFEEFPKRFPDSEYLQAIEIDSEDPGGSFIETLMPQLRARAELGKEQAEEVRQGTIPIASVAAATGRSIGEIWMQIGALPLGYSNEQTSVREHAAAAEAVRKRGATWEPSSIFLVGGLGGEDRDTLRGALPASLICESTFADVANDAGRPRSQPGGTISFDLESGRLQMSEQDREEQERDRLRAEGMLTLARELKTRPDWQPQADRDDWRPFFEDTEVRRPFRVWAATCAVAQRERLAVYSDDRFVRLSAEQLGLPTFGTLALADVLVEEGRLSPERHAAIRRRIFARGAWGMEPTREELIGDARDAGLEPTPGVWAALHDQSAWIGRGILAVEDCLALLESVHSERPEALTVWVRQCIIALRETLGGGHERWVRFLLHATLNPFRDPPVLSDAGAIAVTKSLRDIRYFSAYPAERNLVISVIAESLSAADERRFRAAYLRRVMRRLSALDQAVAITTFIRP
jgi:hypothetical protein